MKIISFLLLLIFSVSLSSCTHIRNNYKLDKEVLNSKNDILQVEILLKKIPHLYIEKKHHSKICPYYGSNGDNIFLSYTTVNFQGKDSILEGRLNPNLQKVDTLKSMEGLTEEEWKGLKYKIRSLAKKGLKQQKYFIYDPDKKGFYIYEYIF